MLFPVYWMINVSFTRDQDMRKSPPRPVPRRTAPWRATGPSLDQQLPYLGTSLVIGLGTVALTVALAAPAGYALAKLRPRGGGVAQLRAADRPDDPRHHHGDGLLRHLPQPRHAPDRCPA